MPLLSLNLGGGLSIDSICHLRNRPALAFHRTFYELFSNAPHFADALRIVLVNRLCEHNSQLISKLLFAWRQRRPPCGEKASLIRLRRLMKPGSALVLRSDLTMRPRYARPGHETADGLPPSLLRRC